MSLTTRMTAFALAALAAVLIGFSLTLYALAWSHLHRHDDERLIAAMETLSAAVEVNPDGVEWEANVRQMRVGRDEPDEAIRWVIVADAGAVVDRAPGLNDAELQDLLASRSPRDWKYGQSRVQHHELGSVPIAPEKHRWLDITAAVPLAPTRAALRWLALSLTGISGAIWLLALPTSRWVCRRALRPVRAMAAQADAMRAVDRGSRLEVAPTADELAALGHAFNGLLDRLDESYERQRRFTGDASHQLRTPLAALLIQVEVALRQPRPVEEYRRVLERVHRQGQNLTQIVEMLLFLARADAEALPAELETVDLTDWLPGYLSRWSQYPRAADLHIEAAGCCHVRVQPPMLGQLLDNLIDNAFKYSQPGSPVTLQLNVDGRSTKLAVEDHGDGIAAEDLPLVFEPFYRSERARKLDRPGVGLGLSVALRIARLFGGTLTAHSQVGEGSRFELTLPIAESPAEDDRPAAVETPSTAATAN